MSRRNRDTRRPRIPFWKDERVFGKIETGWALGGFVVAVIVMLGLLSYLVVQNREHAVSGRQARLHDQQVTDGKLRQLACLAVSDISPGPKSSRIIGDLRRQYQCPAYVETPPPTPRRTGSGPASSPHTSAPASRPTGQASSRPSAVTATVTPARSNPATPAAGSGATARLSPSTTTRAPVPPVASNSPTARPLITLPTLTFGAGGICEIGVCVNTP